MSDYQNSPHKNNIDWLLDNGIAQGYPDGTYRPSEPVTRAQMATFLRNYDDYRFGVPVEPPPIEPPPTDLTPIGSIYHADGKDHYYANVHITGRVTASGTGTRIYITNFIIDGNDGPYAAAGHTGWTPGQKPSGVFLLDGEVFGAEDGFKNSVSTTGVIVHNLSRGYRDNPHGDCHQFEGSAYAEHIGSTFLAYYEDGDYANAAFMLKTEVDGARQEIHVVNCHMEGGNYTVFLRDDHGFGEICAAYFNNVTYKRDAWRYGLASVTPGYDFESWYVSAV